MKKIILLSHEASITGAPIFLLNLSKQLIKTKEYRLVFLFKKSGPLLPKFKKLGSVYSLDFLSHKKSWIFKTFIRVFPLYKTSHQILKFRVRIFNPDIIISNTIINSKLLSCINPGGYKLMTLVHEMKGVIDLFDLLKINNSKLIIKESQQFIADSIAVKNNLENNFQIPSSKIKIISPYLTPPSRFEMQPQEINNWKKSNGVPTSSFIVGTCGIPIWRKGPDIFLNTIKSLKNNHPKEDIFFLWLGGDFNTSAFLDFKNEISNLGLNKYVKFLPSNNDIKFFYQIIDILFCTSREEPFGLTIVEAGLFRKPTVAFEKSGGPEEILSKNRGIIIPYGNFKTASDEIVDLKNNNERRESYSNAIRKYSEKYNSDKNFKDYKEIIDSFI